MSKNIKSTDRNYPIKRRRLLTLVSVVILIPLGIYTKFYPGPGALWVHDSLGGLLYVVFWCLVLYFLFPSGKISIIATAVLIVTCGLEFMQLWNPPFLAFVRSGFIGRSLLGNSFNWLDFPYYFLGAVAGYFWMLLLSKSGVRKNN